VTYEEAYAEWEKKYAEALAANTPAMREAAQKCGFEGWNLPSPPHARPEFKMDAHYWTRLTALRLAKERQHERRN
jgi:hypothetical protein